MHRRKKTIFKQFIFAFILIVSPILLCGLLLIVWQKNVIRDEIEKNAADNVYYSINRLEAQVSMVNRLQFNLMNDKDLNRLVRYYDKVPVYEYYSMVTDVMNRIKLVKEGNECIEDVGIYFGDIGILISQNSGYLRLDTEEYERLAGHLDDGVSPLNTGGEEICTLLKYPAVSRGMLPEYIIKITLSKEKLFHEYLARDMEGRDQIFLFDHGTKQLIYLPGEGMEEAAEAIRPCLESEERMQEIQYGGQKYLAVSQRSDYLNQSVFQCIRMTEIFRVQSLFYKLLGGYLVFTVILIFLYPYSVKRIVNRPVYRLIEAFKGLEKGDLKEQITYKAADEFNYLYDEFNRMVKRLEKLIDENYRSKLYAQKAELKQMQAQINPHFLYNTYFMLHRMILDEDLENASWLSEHVGTYMEYITHNSDDEVALEKEAEHARSYLEIQRMRFGSRMRVRMQEVPSELADLQVPRLILQPVIENYLKYGYEVSEEGGEFTVLFEETLQGLVITVKGGCAPIGEKEFRELGEKLDSAGDKGEVTGLINIHRRLKIRFGEGFGIRIRTDDAGRLVTQLVIGCGGKERE